MSVFQVSTKNTTTNSSLNSTALKEFRTCDRCRTPWQRRSFIRSYTLLWRLMGRYALVCNSGLTGQPLTLLLWLALANSSQKMTTESVKFHMCHSSTLCKGTVRHTEEPILHPIQPPFREKANYTCNFSRWLPVDQRIAKRSCAS